MSNTLLKKFVERYLQLVAAQKITEAHR